MTANRVLLQREGHGSATAISLPPGYAGALLAAVPAASSDAPSAADGSLEGADRAHQLQQARLHPVLLDYLDLVVARGGMELAGIQFLQLQVGVGWLCTRPEDAWQYGMGVGVSGYLSVLRGWHEGGVVRCVCVCVCVVGGGRGWPAIRG